MYCTTFITYMYNASNIISTCISLFIFFVIKKHYIHLKKFCHILQLPHICTYISQSNISSFRLKTKTKTKHKSNFQKRGKPVYIHFSAFVESSLSIGAFTVKVAAILPSLWLCILISLVDTDSWNIFQSQWITMYSSKRWRILYTGKYSAQIYFGPFHSCCQRMNL